MSAWVRGNLLWKERIFKKKSEIPQNDLTKPNIEGQVWGTLQKQQEIFFCCSLYFESYVHIPAEFHPIISYNITPDCIFSRCRNTKACTDEICNNAPYHLRFSRRGTMVTRADVSRIREVTKRSFRSLTKAPVRRKIEPYAPARSEIRVRNRNPPWYDRAQKTCHPTRTCNLYECGIR